MLVCLRGHSHCVRMPLNKVWSDEERQTKRKNMAKKLYLLDTNVLINNPQAIFSFEGVTVGIPAIALEQLDAFKREGTDRGRNAREVIRCLDALRSRGSLGQGVTLDNGSILKIIFLPAREMTLPFKMPVEDNEILLMAVMLKDEGYDVLFISKDLNARVKADTLGIPAQDYIKEYVSKEEFYKGWRRVPVPSVQLKKDSPQELDDLADSKELAVNEFVLLESQHNPHNYRIFRYLGGKRFLPVVEPKLHWPLKPRNVQQLMAMNLLLDKSILFVSLFGPAGTGKTFLALLAGLHQILVEDEYEKMLIARPVIPLGRDIGYLPGTLQEKLYTWMLPIYDNMELITYASSVGQHNQQLQEHDQHEHRHRNKRHNHNNKHHDNWHRYEKGQLMPIEELIRRKKISLEAITYMRGRSIPYQFILIDEVQNLTPHEVKTLVSRVGEGSKIVITGDPYQIDSPYLDFSSNGLIVTGERFKGQQVFGSVYLEMTERSKLSQLASELL